MNTFNAGKALAQARGWPFNWRPVELAGVGQDAKKMFAAPQASAALSPLSGGGGRTVPYARSPWQNEWIS